MSSKRRFEEFISKTLKLNLLEANSTLYPELVHHYFLSMFHKKAKTHPPTKPTRAVTITRSAAFPTLNAWMVKGLLRKWILYMKSRIAWANPMATIMAHTKWKRPRKAPRIIPVRTLFICTFVIMVWIKWRLNATRWLNRLQLCEVNFYWQVL